MKSLINKHQRQAMGQRTHIFVCEPHVISICQPLDCVRAVRRDVANLLHEIISEEELASTVKSRSRLSPVEFGGI